MENKQTVTAVEWLFEELNIWQTIADEDTNATLDTVRKLLEQAKEMEKQQIMMAIKDSWYMAKGSNFQEPQEEQYYKETYGSKGSVFLEGYEQIDQNNPVTRGSTALVKKEEQKKLITEIMEEDAKDGLYESKGSELKCPECGSIEVDAMTPNTVYECGSKDYDQRPNTFNQSDKCKELSKANPTSSQTEISDEEIEKAKEYHWSYRNGFVEGAKWYREQLKKKENEKI